VRGQGNSGKQVVAAREDNERVTVGVVEKLAEKLAEMLPTGSGP
jgi:hypothetical protein